MALPKLVREGIQEPEYRIQNKVFAFGSIKNTKFAGATHAFYWLLTSGF
jgi:hypothetical protein